jgi:hypothetical protein
MKKVPLKCNEKIKKINCSHQGVPVIELNGDTHVQQYLYQYQTNAEINNNIYDEVTNQKLKLFNRGKCHIRGTISI